MKYKVTNPLEQPIKCGKLVFSPKETKILEKIPGEGFIIEELEESRKENKSNRR